MKFNKSITSYLVVIVLMSCQYTSNKESATTHDGKIKVTILYPNNDGKTFDYVLLFKELYTDGLEFMG